MAALAMVDCSWAFFMRVLRGEEFVGEFVALLLKRADVFAERGGLGGGGMRRPCRPLGAAAAASAFFTPGGDFIGERAATCSASRGFGGGFFDDLRR